MTEKECMLIEKFKEMNLAEFEEKVSILYESKPTFSEEFDINLRNIISNKYLGELPYNDTPYEESLEKWFNSLSKEDQEAFLNEDWSEFNYV